MKTSKYSLLVTLVGLSSAVIADDQPEALSADSIESSFIRPSRGYQTDVPTRDIADRASRVSLADSFHGIVEKIQRETPSLSPKESEYLATEVAEIGQIDDRERQEIRFNALWAKGLHHRQKIRSQCDDALRLIHRIKEENISLPKEMRCWIALYSEFNYPSSVTDAVEYMVAEGFWKDQSGPFSFEWFLKYFTSSAFSEVIEPAASRIKNPDDSEPYLPQQGDVGIEIKGLILDEEWYEVVLVHGYPNNHGPAEMIKKMADDTSGRPEGSFRLKEH